MSGWVWSDLEAAQMKNIERALGVSATKWDREDVRFLHSRLALALAELQRRDSTGGMRAGMDRCEYRCERQAHDYRCKRGEHRMPESATPPTASAGSSFLFEGDDGQVVRMQIDATPPAPAPVANERTCMTANCRGTVHADWCPASGSETVELLAAHCEVCDKLNVYDERRRK